MPRMALQNVSVAANTLTTNQLAGLNYEFLPGPAHVIVAAAAAAVGLNMNFIVANGLIVLNDMPVSQANRFPQLPEDIAFEDDLPPGRLILTLRNTTAAAIVLNGAFVDITFY